MVDRLRSLQLPTPALVYVEDSLTEALGKLAAVEANQLFFALKACYRPPVLQSLCRAGIGAEVMSPLEFELAIKAGFSPKKIVVNGLGRSYEFLQRTVNAGCYLIADTLSELEFLGQICPKARLGVRLSTELPTSLSYHQASKLGLTFDKLEPYLERFSPSILHLHVTSQQTDAGPLNQLLEQLPWKGFEVLDLGGGWETAQDVERSEFTELGRAFRETHPNKSLWLEPGRAVVNGAGFLLTRVTATKNNEKKRYVIVDAPTSTMMPHKEATYRLLHPQPGDKVEIDLVDGITSLTSTLKAGVWMSEEPEIGELLILGNCGAYTSAMSQFWAFPPIPTYFLCSDGELLPDIAPPDVQQARDILFAFRQ